MKKIPANRKKELEEKLDKLAKKVSAKPVYVVKKTDMGYNLVHYITDAILISDIPDLTLAKRMADRANSKKSLRKDDINRFNNRLKIFYKYYNDIQFYTYTIKNSSDFTKVEAVKTRLQDAKWNLKHARSALFI